MHRHIPAVISIFAIVAVSACTGPTVRNAARSQNSAYKAQEAVAKQRLDFVAKYQECVDDAGNDIQMIEACDVYLKSAEALS